MGPRALAKAKEERTSVLLSNRVFRVPLMPRDGSERSFENEEIAKQMNDELRVTSSRREERHDLDQTTN